MKKLVLSKEILDLENSNTRLNYEDHYKETCENDECFSNVLDFFQAKLAGNSNGNDMITLAKATEFLNKGMLTIYYLMQVQSEINEIHK